jgi:hypothetical protein
MDRDMSDAFSRRGFLKLAGAAGIVVCLPSIVRADNLNVTARLQPVDALAGRLGLDLYIRHDRNDVVVFRPRSAHLELTIERPNARSAVMLWAVSDQDDYSSRAPRTRAMPRPPQIVVPAGREHVYGRFDGQWPAELARQHGQAQATARIVLDIEPDGMAPVEREPLAALARATARTTVTLPG